MDYFCQLELKPVKVKGDRKALMQVLTHLIDNALKYSDADEPITVKLSQTDDWAVIQVCDNGCGIAQRDQRSIFEPFYRVDPSRARSTGGVGLGLSFVKSLVEGMGGQVTVQSTQGIGSTFVVRACCIKLEGKTDKGFEPFLLFQVQGYNIYRLKTLACFAGNRWVNWGTRTTNPTMNQGVWPLDWLCRLIQQALVTLPVHSTQD